MNSILCIVASLFQEAMIRRIKRKFGQISLVLFSCAIPLTFFNITFSDPAPYFTLCTFGCFSVEECTTKDQDWGNYTSLSFVFALAFLLSAEVLAIRFNLLFIRFTASELRLMVEEVKEKYNDGDDNNNKKDGDVSESDVTKYPGNVTNNRLYDGQFDAQWDSINEQKFDMVEILDDNMMNDVRLRSEFVRVQRTRTPIQYYAEVIDL
jgi:hypothetical protein